MSADDLLGAMSGYDNDNETPGDIVATTRRRLLSLPVETNNSVSRHTVAHRRKNVTTSLALDACCSCVEAGGGYKCDNLCSSKGSVMHADSLVSTLFSNIMLLTRTDCLDCIDNSPDPMSCAFEHCDCMPSPGPTPPSPDCCACIEDGKGQQCDDRQYCSNIEGECKNCLSKGGDTKGCASAVCRCPAPFPTPIPGPGPSPPPFSPDCCACVADGAGNDEDCKNKCKVG